MVEEPDSVEESTPPPSLRAAPIPPASSDVSGSMILSQWEFPPIQSPSPYKETSIADVSASS